ncbi:hypothetical protein BP6252_03645 [Coleophoma cylindrospora]|uniref:Uncharacterized protein n=1 Tax=Coleophoma cylindrospora TaxID=1849047 RepID=A0A3D8S890_9HELO|nr:hypothetical protein BP6252_03645 [Coleophoma cylindrospora]
MPFDYVEYEKKCQELSTEQLQKEWENYTRQLAGGATSTTTSVLFSPLTGGISLIGLGLSAPRVHNARKKRDIIQEKLTERGAIHNTRMRDVIAPMAVAGTLGGLTLGLAGPGADMIAGEAVGKGAEYAIAHAALDATGATLEHKHDKHSKMKAYNKLQTQYENFKIQYQQEQAKLQGQTPTSSTGAVPYTPQPSYGVPPAAPDYNWQAAAAPNPQMQSQTPSDYKSISEPPTYQPGLIQHPQQQPQTQNQVQNQGTIYGPPIYQPGLPSYQPASHQQQIFQHQAVPATATPMSSASLPLYSEVYSPTIQTMPSDQKPAAVCTPSTESSDPVSTAPETPQHPIGQPPAPSMEDEIAFLKAKLLEMELEKRGIITTDQSQPDQSLPQPEPSKVSVPESQTQLSRPPTTTPSVNVPGLGLPHLTVQTHLPSHPATPNTAPADLKSPLVSVQPYMPSRPTTPNIQSPNSNVHENSLTSNAGSTTPSAQPQNYGFPPPPPPPPAQYLAPYQPQNYAIAPPCAPQQQQYQYASQQMYQPRPQFPSQDSGYYSNPTTPGLISPQSSDFKAPISPPNNPYHPQHQFLSPQSTGYSVLTPHSTGGFSAMSPQSTGHTSFSSVSMAQHAPMPANQPMHCFPPPPPPGAPPGGLGQSQYNNTAPTPPFLPPSTQAASFSAPYAYPGYGQVPGETPQPMYYPPPPHSSAPQRS